MDRADRRRCRPCLPRASGPQRAASRKCGANVSGGHCVGILYAPRQRKFGPTCRDWRKFSPLGSNGVNGDCPVHFAGPSFGTRGRRRCNIRGGDFRNRLHGLVRRSSTSHAEPRSCSSTFCSDYRCGHWCRIAFRIIRHKIVRRGGDDHRRHRNDDRREIEAPEYLCTVDDKSFAVRGLLSLGKSEGGTKWLHRMIRRKIFQTVNRDMRKTIRLNKVAEPAQRQAALWKTKIRPVRLRKTRELLNKIPGLPEKMRT